MKEPRSGSSAAESAYAALVTFASGPSVRTTPVGLCAPLPAVVIAAAVLLAMLFLLYARTRVGTAPAAELGATPITGLVAYARNNDDTGWDLLPSWVDRETGDLHVSVPGNRTVAVAAVTPRTIPLQPGWNLVTYTGAPDTPVAFLFGGLPSVIDAIHRWDPAGGRFLSAFPFAPSHSTRTPCNPETPSGYMCAEPKSWSGPSSAARSCRGRPRSRRAGIWSPGWGPRYRSPLARRASLASRPSSTAGIP